MPTFIAIIVPFHALIVMRFAQLVMRFAQLSTGPKRPRPIGARYASVESPEPALASDQHFLDCFDHLFRRKSELREQHLGGGGGAEMVDAHDLPLQAYVLAPGCAHARFYGHAARDPLGQHA